jgi:hypothetical protein
MLAYSLILFAACTSLSLSMTRHHRDVRGSVPSRSMRANLRVAGWGLLCASYAIAGTVRGWSKGTLEWLCVFGLVALIVALLLNYRPRVVPVMAAGAVLLAVVMGICNVDGGAIR